MTTIDGLALRTWGRNLIELDQFTAMVNQEMSALGACDQGHADLLGNFKTHRGYAGAR